MTTEKYTLEQCKADMLLLWGILKDNPHISSKKDAIGLINGSAERCRFKNMENECPCCEYAESKAIGGEKVCGYCPAWNIDHGEGCCHHHKDNKDGEYEVWSWGFDDETRQQAAQIIYDRALRIKV